MSHHHRPYPGQLQPGLGQPDPRGDVGDGVVIGGHAGIKDNVEIGPGARVAAMAGVMDDVPARATVIGAPAVGHIEFFRRIAMLKRLTAK